MKRKRHNIKMKRCRYCRATENLTKDHIVPLIQGGKDEIKNLQVLCKRCNEMKSGLSHKQLRNLWKFFIDINASREAHGKKPLLWKYKEKMFIKYSNNLDKTTIPSFNKYII